MDKNFLFLLFPDFFQKFSYFPDFPDPLTNSLTFPDFPDRVETLNAQKTNLQQFLGCCRLQDSNFNETGLHQGDVLKKV